MVKPTLAPKKIFYYVGNILVHLSRSKFTVGIHYLHMIFVIVTTFWSEIANFIK